MLVGMALMHLLYVAYRVSGVDDETYFLVVYLVVSAVTMSCGLLLLWFHQKPVNLTLATPIMSRWNLASPFVSSTIFPQAYKMRIII